MKFSFNSCEENSRTLLWTMTKGTELWAICVALDYLHHSTGLWQNKVACAIRDIDLLTFKESARQCHLHTDLGCDMCVECFLQYSLLWN
jgi:hypothetical protein